MLLNRHKGYTEAALDGLTLNADIQKEITTGCIANDLCELTDIIDPFIGTHEFSQRVRSYAAPEARMAPRSHSIIAVYETHFGDLASMHAMAKGKGESVEVTKIEIEHWFMFLNQVALGRRIVAPGKEIGDDTSPISHFFGKDSKIEYDQIFASENLFKIKNRAVGMMCHLIQDLFTISHCQRDSSKKIKKFYHYPSQNSTKHKEADDTIHISDQELIAHCRECIERISQKRPYNYLAILELTEHPQKSDDGPFA
ncbi:hypothetical protein [Candidatus Electronema sp. PJ]|uniref:hypothetical protein n=1 Tax=Candidatus Electronema sp. PJ TaxID=3401572 RepID=UPI003AA91BC0